MDPTTEAIIRRHGAAMQRDAIADPLDAGEAPRLQMHRRLGRGGHGPRAVLASMSVESCGCLAETPLWHVSVSVWSLVTRAKMPDEVTALAVCEAMLTGVGQERSLWWWNPAVRVGHLRSHLTAAEALAVPPHVPGPEDHQEDGEWYDRKW